MLSSFLLAMRPSGGETKTELALQLAREVMASGRRGAVKLVFLITDGHPDDDTEAIYAAAELHRAVSVLCPPFSSQAAT